MPFTYASFLLAESLEQASRFVYEENVCAVFVYCLFDEAKQKKWMRTLDEDVLVNVSLWTEE